MEYETPRANLGIAADGRSTCSDVHIIVIHTQEVKRDLGDALPFLRRERRVVSGTSNGLWPEVSKAHPCPKCNHDSWCAVSSDCVWCRCYRSQDGGEQKTDTNGAPYRLYRLI